MSKRRLAVLIAGILAAPIGIASVTGLATPAESQPETPLQSEAAEPAATEQAEAPQPSPAGEQIATADRQPAPEVGYVVPARPRTLADATFPPLQSDVFPPSTDDKPLLPSLAAYLERKAANTLLADAGAPQPVFPGYDEGTRMLPSQLAYFERLEAARLAAAEAREREAQQAMAAPASATVSVTPETTPAGTTAEADIDRVAENVRQ